MGVPFNLAVLQWQQRLQAFQPLVSPQVSTKTKQKSNVKTGLNIIKKAEKEGTTADISSIFTAMQLDNGKGKNSDFGVNNIKGEISIIDKKIKSYESAHDKGKKAAISESDYNAYKKELDMLNNILSSNKDGDKKVTKDEFDAMWGKMTAAEQVTPEATPGTSEKALPGNLGEDQVITANNGYTEDIYGTGFNWSRIKEETQRQKRYNFMSSLFF